MPRAPRCDVAGHLDHVLNRGKQGPCLIYSLPWLTPNLSLKNGDSKGMKQEISGVQSMPDEFSELRLRIVCRNNRD